jgi:signal transduction histidine kinase/CheY-like chemotaxis protein
VIPRMAEWDEKLFNASGYLAEPVESFSGFIYDVMRSSGIEAIMAFPVYLHGEFWGYVTLENKHDKRLCSDWEASILQSVSLLLANAVERYDSMMLLNQRLAQQQLMSNISKTFITKEQMGNLINDALARMGTFMNVVCVLIAVFEKDSDICRPEYVWYADPKYKPNSTQTGYSSIIRELFPYYANDSDRTPTIYCDNSLTYENGKFSQIFEKSGIKSLICAPIYVDSELWGIMSIEEHERFRHWSESDAQLVSSVSSAIASAVARDVMESERSAALEEAIKASRAKGDFLSNMSHEIRTPMNAIIGMTSLGIAATDKDRMLHCFKKIDDASKHLLGIINDILDISKIEANKLKLSCINFEFEKMLQNVIDVVNFRLDERRQKLYVNIDKEIPQKLFGDDLRLAQVVTNLLSNAIKFTPEEGSIRLEANLLLKDNEMCCLQISVEDSGIGITEEQMGRLFNAFEQAEVGTTRKFGGTGLGLAISKRIVEMMGGEISVESKPESGAKFTFDVSLKSSSAHRKRLLPDSVNWSNIRIFAVDDEPEIRKFFMDVSESLGIHCKVASSGEEALTMLSNDDNYNIYFIDWKLPEMNGLELARRVYDETSRKSVAVMFSSGEWSDIEGEANAAGVRKFLPKPLLPSAIVDAINECIGKKSTLKQIEEDKNPVDFSGHSVLLAEDVEINREIVLALLEPTQLIVECAENGLQAVQMFTEAPNKYSLILMDVQMPEIDGCEATRRIRALGGRGVEVPIVAMTANVFREDVERCINAGMSNHIGKPLDFNEVLTILRKYLLKKNS